MKPLSAVAAVLALAAAPAFADDATDRLNKAVEALSAQDGYVLAAQWRLDIEKVKEPVKGTVESLVRHREDFLKLHAKFDEGEVTVYQKGAQIAGQNAETKQWGPISDDAKAKFVLKMFNLKAFLTEAAGMATNARLSKGDKDEELHLEFEADKEKLKKLLGDAEAGKALTNGTLDNATMKVAIDFDRKSGVPRRVTVDIEGDSTHTPRKAASPPPDDGFKPWTGEDDAPPAKDDKKDDGAKKPEEPPAPIVEHIKVHLEAIPDYKQSLDAEVPEAVKKVLGL
ncbi:MAG: hypothetical protein AAB074_01710 [Planctomycetota bacterium]